MLLGRLLVWLVATLTLLALISTADSEPRGGGRGGGGRSGGGRKGGGGSSGGASRAGKSGDKSAAWWIWWSSPSSSKTHSSSKEANKLIPDSKHSDDLWKPTYYYPMTHHSSSGHKENRYGLGSGNYSRLTTTTESSGFFQSVGRFFSKREAPAEGDGSKSLICYYDNRAALRSGPNRLSVDKLDANLCSHLVYGYATLSEDNLIQLSESESLAPMKELRKMRQRNPKLKVLIAIDGDSDSFARVAQSPRARQRFIRSVAQFLARFELDGVALDWPLTNQAGEQVDADRSKPLDAEPSSKGEDFAQLLRELRASLNSKYLLTASVAAQKDSIDSDYRNQVRELPKLLDFIILRSYNYRRKDSTKTAHRSPLYHSTGSDRSAVDLAANVNWTVNYWLAKGAPAEKLVLSIPLFGTSYGLESEQQGAGIGAQVEGPADAGFDSSVSGSLNYNEICEMIANNKTTQSQWKVTRDSSYRVPYAQNRKQWVAYEDEKSVAEKAQYANQLNLAGVAVLSLDGDSFDGRCHADSYHLTRIIKRELDNQLDPSVRSSNSVDNSGPLVDLTDAMLYATEIPRLPGADRLPPQIAAASNIRPPEATTTTRRPTRPTFASIINTSSSFSFTERPFVPNAFSGYPRPPEVSAYTISEQLSYTSPNTGLSPPVASAQTLPVCGAGGLWYFPGPDCRHYYDCTGGRPKLVQCQKDYFWKQSRLWCDFRENVPECSN